MRTFIAIALPKEIKNRLANIQGKLKEYPKDAKWVSLENIHLTLKFLGEIGQEKLNDVIKVTKEVAQDKPQFKIALSGLGLFPDNKRPKVVWAGIKEGKSEIETLAYGLEEELKRLGIPKDKKTFSPHITLGRIKPLMNTDKLKQSLNTINDEFYNEWPEFTADKITIFKSTLSPQGPVYDILKEMPLKAT